MKNIAILGSTGSIGCNALKVIDLNPDKYRVVALAAGRNADLLLKQVEQYRPLYAALDDEALAANLRDRIRHLTDTQVVFGTKGFIRMATLEEVDTVISSMMGAAGLAPTYAAITAGKQIALANQVFTPSEEAVNEAREILAAMEQAKANGEGATVYKGRLVDIASIKQAEVIVAQAELIAANG